MVKLKASECYEVLLCYLSFYNNLWMSDFWSKSRLLNQSLKLDLLNKVIDPDFWN